MLTGLEILRQRDLGRIVIDPLTGSVNPNSVNLRLHPKIYEVRKSDCASTKVHGIHYEATKPIGLADVVQYEIDKQFGFDLLPGILYIASTVERAGSDYYVPTIEGRSSVARMGLSVHTTAGFGDLGFKNQWTLEITVVNAIRIYPLIEICQIAFHEAVGEIQLYDGKYTMQDGPTLSKGVKMPDYEHLEKLGLKLR